MHRILDKIPIKVWVVNDDELHMQFSDGTSCKWYHKQDCCESVSINDIIGDLQGLVDLPLLVAEERSSEGEYPPDLGYEPESCTWTFYTFRNVSVSVDVRWFGESNGYYSESVDFQYVGPN